jgi:CRP-like cAMP-binding protein
MIGSVAPSALTRVNAASAATKSLFERLAGAPLPRWYEFATQVHLKPVEAGGTVFMQGAEHPYVYVVRRGLIKNVYLRDTGDAWIKSFSSEGRFFASVAALKPGGRASFSAVCVEDSELERFPFKAIESLADSDLAWSTVLRRALAIFADRKEQRERELLTLNPEDRYRAVLAEQPDIEGRVTQKDLAAYIGITPVGLNRIVRRVKG